MWLKKLEPVGWNICSYKEDGETGSSYEERKDRCHTSWCRTEGLIFVLSLFFNTSRLLPRAAPHWARERRRIASSCRVAVWRWHDWHRNRRRTNREAAYSFWTTIKWEGHDGCPSGWMSRVGRFPCRHEYHEHIFPLRKSPIQVLVNCFFRSDLTSLVIRDDRKPFALSLSRIGWRVK